MVGGREAVVPEGSQQEGKTLNLLAEGVGTAGDVSMPSHGLKGICHGGRGDTEGKVASRTLASLVTEDTERGDGARLSD